jgi:hypothetical protein
VAIKNEGRGGGGSNAVPIVLGIMIVVAGIVALVYWRWSRAPYDADDDFWTDEPPPTTQGPLV